MQEKYISKMLRKYDRQNRECQYGSRVDPGGGRNIITPSYLTSKLRPETKYFKQAFYDHKSLPWDPPTSTAYNLHSRYVSLTKNEWFVFCTSQHDVPYLTCSILVLTSMNISSSLFLRKTNFGSCKRRKKYACQNAMPTTPRYIFF